jgi:hypothetical protein
MTLLAQGTRAARLAAHAGLAVLTLAAAAAAQPRVVSKAVFPPVVPADGSTPALVEVRTDLAATSVTLELAGGGTVSFSALDAQTFTAILTNTQLLDGYGPDDVNRNFVGFLRVAGGPDELTTFNFFVNVDDGTFPDVPVSVAAPDLLCAPHVVNLHVPPTVPADLWDPLDDDPAGLLTRFYDVFGDDYDFANLVFLHPDHTTNRDHFAVRNDVLGIGVAVFDSSALYGSAGRLQGITRFPLDTFFDLAQPDALHELGHQWINFLGSQPLLGSGVPHWPPSEPARGLMGFNIPGTGGVGGTFSFAFTPLGGGLFSLDPATPLGVYTALDLYLMGMIPPELVPPFVVLDPPDQPLTPGSTVSGTTLAVADVIAAAGPRVPSAATSTKDFRMATVVVTRTGPLTLRELAFFDHFAARAEATSPVPYASGFAKGEAQPFAPATGGLGTLDASVTCPLPKIPLPDLREFQPICIFCPPDPCLTCPPLFRGLDWVILTADVRTPGIRTSLRSKVVAAGEAFTEGRLAGAGGHLRAFLHELDALEGRAVPASAAAVLGKLTRQAAALLGIPLDREVKRVQGDAR